jgi:transcriptional regulator with XRE-family HTH domain
MQDAKRRDLGQKLKECREYLGLSQEDVAAHLGVPRTAISQLERGNRKVDALELQTLARLYQRPLEYLTGEDAEAPKESHFDILGRAASRLSETDREEVTRFAEFLLARAKTRTKSS